MMSATEPPAGPGGCPSSGAAPGRRSPATPPPTWSCAATPRDVTSAADRLRRADLAEIARATAAESRPLAAAQGIDVVERIESPAPVEADPRRLGQALSG